MTYYYYLASDIPLQKGYYYDEGFHLNFNNSTSHDEILTLEKSDEHIKGFDYPIQIEIFNGVEQEEELQKLLYYIQEQTASYKVCSVQIAKLINSNKIKFKVKEKSKLLLHEITNPKQLLLSEGHLITIKKVPTFF
ncbi:hypothetical protein [Oceanobacillus sp. FSL K6-0127]|uniref:hypothetical protein n=1 Tax=unclassified Oceanobacillus TaxID=2630292 RepID=UPI0030EE71DF